MCSSYWIAPSNSDGRHCGALTALSTSAPPQLNHYYWRVAMPSRSSYPNRSSSTSNDSWTATDSTSTVSWKQWPKDGGNGSALREVRSICNSIGFNSGYCSLDLGTLCCSGGQYGPRSTASSSQSSTRATRGPTSAPVSVPDAGLHGRAVRRLLLRFFMPAVGPLGAVGATSGRTA